MIGLTTAQTTVTTTATDANSDTQLLSDTLSFPQQLASTWQLGGPLRFTASGKQGADTHSFSSLLYRLVHTPHLFFCGFRIFA